MFTEALFTIAKTQKQTSMSINRGTDQEDVVDMYNGLLLSQQTKVIMPFGATWMNLEIIIRSEVRKRKTNTTLNLKYDTNLQIYETETYS